MASEAPPFWWEPADWRARALAPAAAVYGAVARRRLENADAVKVGAPVVCVGNFTVGGVGKTPVAVALAKQARAMGLKPGFVSRGYGGSQKGPHLVDPAADSAARVGDEPLILARHGDTAVAARRPAAAELLIRYGCDFLIMDDGFQSRRLHYDHAVLLVSAGHGLGNGRVIPAGPLRAGVVDQLRHADSVLVMGKGEGATGVVRLAARAGRPVYEAWHRPLAAERFANRRFVAFAGIGHPERFFSTLEQAGAIVEMRRAFPDHHMFSRDALAELLATARGLDVDLVTTEKDAARLGSMVTPPGFKERLKVLEIEACFEDSRVPERIVSATLDAWKRRRFD